MDMAKPIPALRHDQPRRPADWSIDHMLRGGDVSPAERRSRPNTQDFGEAESVLSTHANVRLPRPEVSLYQSQIDGPTFGARSSSPLSADTPSGHYSNRAPKDLDEVVDEPPNSARPPHGGGGVFDNFILKGPGIQRSATDAGARRREDERPLPRSRLEQLFDDHPPSVDVVPTHRLDSDGARLPHVSDSSGADNSTHLADADNTRTNSFTVTTRSVFQ